MNPTLSDNARLVGVIQKRVDTAIVVTVHTHRGSEYVDVREWVESDNFVGWTKKGLRLSSELVPELIDLLHDAWASEGQTRDLEVSERHAGLVTNVPPAYALGIRVLGEQLESIADTVGSSVEAVIAALRASEPICPRCSRRVGTEGRDMYVCPSCSRATEQNAPAN